MDRKHLARELERWITEGHLYFEETGRFQSKRPLLKSYLVEANAPEVTDHPDGVAQFFERLELPLLISVVSTEDPTLHRAILRTRQSESVFFLDTLDPRIWVFHSIAPANEAEQAMRRLIHQTRYLDACWFPSRQLNDWSGEVGVPRSLTAKFAVPSLLYGETINDEAFLYDSLYMRIGSRGDARARWRQIADTNAVLGPQLALWSTKVVRSLENSGLFISSDITAVGKLTSKGNSFRMHQEIISGLRSRYKEMIEGWESTYRLGWEPRGSGVYPSGQTAVLRFPEPKSSDQLETLVTQIFNCSEPFRLFGIPSRQGEHHYSVRGVDLHTGGKVDFELTRDVIRIYLYPSTCANVIARLLTNGQHFIDARLELV